MQKIAIIGCGSMGSAFARGLSSGYTLILYDRNQAKREALSQELNQKEVSTLSEAVCLADLIVLAIKPKDLPEIVENCSEMLGGKTIISLLTGVTLINLQESFPESQIVRIMPNLGVVYQQGVIAAVQDPTFPVVLKGVIESILNRLGTVIWMEESKIDPFIALSGSGIAFILVMIEAMLDGGVLLGFNAELAQQIVLCTMRGACTLVQESGKHPAELKIQISSPGGTTISGLKAMEEAGVRAGILQTLNACYEKAIRITREMEARRKEPS